MKKYVADRIPYKEYQKWLPGKKVVIIAPTGMGKGTFVLDSFLEHCKEKGMKVLILCNRRLLRSQYYMDLAERFWRQSEIDESVVIRTYQEMAEKLRDTKNVNRLLEDYDVIVADEIHYFLQDADFNPYGTYVLLQALVQAGYFKTMLFLTATYSEVEPVLKETFLKVKEKLKGTLPYSTSFIEYDLTNEFVYDYTEEADYSHLRCFYVEDEGTLLDTIAKSSKKSVIFIDDIKLAEKLKEELKNNWKIPEEEIFLLNASVMDEKPGDEVIRSLAIAHRVKPKILITTSVLDNGVSIHDRDVGNIVLATESKISFLQMIGRIRTENTDGCNVYLFPRDTAYYSKRIRQLKEKLEIYSKYRNYIEKDDLQVLYDAWYDNGNDGKVIRTGIVITREEHECIQERRNRLFTRQRGFVLAFNVFAYEKLGNLLLAEKIFYKKSLINPVEVAQAQFAWLNKEAFDIEIMQSTYKEQKLLEMKEKILTIQDFSSEQFSQIKVDIAKEYRDALFSHILFKGKSFENKKFQEVCSLCNLQFIIEEKDGKNSYKVVELDQDVQGIKDGGEEEDGKEEGINS